MFTIFQVRKSELKEETWLYRTDYYIRNRRISRKSVCLELAHQKRYEFLERIKKGTPIPHWFKEERGITFFVIDRIFSKQEFTELEVFDLEIVMDMVKKMKENEKLNILIRR